MRERENSTTKTKFTVTGTPPVPPKMTVECTGKETKKRAGGENREASLHVLSFVLPLQE